jgi:HEAT repeat protein
MNYTEYDITDRQIQETARSLGLADEKKRLQARKSLEAAGKRAVLILIEALQNGNQYARREAATALAYIKPPNAARALVGALKDDDHDVRWASMKALIALDQEAIEPLLLALTKDFASVHLREGAKHILNRMKQDSCLENPLLGVLQALEGLQPTATVPWAAETAWEELYGPKKKKK